MSNPLDSFASSNAGTSDFRVNKIPTLEPLVRANGLMEGLKQFDREMETWREHLERSINTRIQSKQPAGVQAG